MCDGLLHRTGRNIYLETSSRIIRFAFITLIIASQTQAQSTPNTPFIFGFDQVAGIGTPNPATPGLFSAETWVLTDDELASLKNDFHVTALRFFVHPAFIGLPQATWDGMESIQYSSFPDSAFVWNRPGGPVDSLDEVIAKLRSYDILPIIQIVTPQEYILNFNRTDLTFLNNPANVVGGKRNPLNYAGIIPQREVIFLLTKISKHVHDVFGDNFGINFQEIGGLRSPQYPQSGDTCRERETSGERKNWTQLVHAVKAVAPGAVVMSPELLMGLWYWAAASPLFYPPPGTAPKLTCPMTFGQPLQCDTWPGGLPIPEYRDFDMISASLYTDTSFKDPCTNHPLRKTTDAALKLLRDQALPQRWIWAETGWGAPGTDVGGLTSTLDGFHLDWAANLLVPDNIGGFLLWQSKGTSTNPWGVFTRDGHHDASYDFVKNAMTVLWENRDFLSTRHTKYNADGFTVADDSFSENDDQVFTRRLGNYLIVYSIGPQAVSFTNVSDTYVSLFSSDNTAASPAVSSGPNSVTISGLTPNRLYVFRTDPAFDFPAGGGASRSTDGTGATVITGYARIQPTAGNTTPTGIAIFGYRRNGILVSEAGVPAAPLLQTGRLYAETSSRGSTGPETDTGLAIANPNSSAATLGFYLTDANGNTAGSGSTTIGPGQQIAQFLSQAPFKVYTGGSFQGTFSFTSTLPLAVVALRGFTNERGDFLISTLPVIDTTEPPNTATTVVPHFADGGGWTTQVLLVNPTESPMAGTVQFMNQAGAAANVTIGGQTNSSFPYSIPMRTSQKLSTSGLGPTTASGSIRITPNGSGAGPTPLIVFSYNPAGITLSEAGVAVTSGSAFRVYVESSGATGQAGSIQSGIAVANTSGTSANVTFDITDLTGAPITGMSPVTVPLAPYGQTAKYLSDLFPSQLNAFKGVLRITTTSSGLSVVGLRLRINERGDLLFTTTPPANESTPPASTPVFFPQVADGGGYTTQFILFSGTAGQTGSGTLQILKQDGSPLAITLN